MPPKRSKTAGVKKPTSKAVANKNVGAAKTAGKKITALKSQAVPGHPPVSASDKTLHKKLRELWDVYVDDQKTTGDKIETILTEFRQREMNRSKTWNSDIETGGAKYHSVNHLVWKRPKLTFVHIFEPEDAGVWDLDAGGRYPGPNTVDTHDAKAEAANGTAKKIAVPPPDTKATKKAKEEADVDAKDLPPRPEPTIKAGVVKKDKYWVFEHPSREGLFALQCTAPGCPSPIFSKHPFRPELDKINGPTKAQKHFERCAPDIAESELDIFRRFHRQVFQDRGKDKPVSLSWAKKQNRLIIPRNQEELIDDNVFPILEREISREDVWDGTELIADSHYYDL
ncbi:hypothetical protein B0T22DRAFT_535844 [Podospora appendiculata]|uniref:Uncharacterized protein n=1 Tax=Podospora appendiculata TaxID=314037 RepID=A0AAE0XA76_9PEZI|nr:hypothetical protein B0T22DRAFT_535844 [Podospora appendiculata]